MTFKFTHGMLDKGTEQPVAQTVVQEVPWQKTDTSRTPLPKYRDAPAGTKIIESSRYCVALTLEGLYLGLYSFE